MPFNFKKINFKIVGVVVIAFVASGSAYYYYSCSSDIPSLKVMTYSSFLSPYGPSKEIEKRFEKKCKCRVRWVEAEDSTLMVQKMNTRPDGLGIDVVLGLDQITLAKSKKWKNLSIYNHPWTRSARYWVSSRAIPISWSPLTFISKNQTLLQVLNLYLIKSGKIKYLYHTLFLVLLAFNFIIGFTPA